MAKSAAVRAFTRLIRLFAEGKRGEATAISLAKSREISGRKPKTTTVAQNTSDEFGKIAKSA
ncbi:hypothetical protein INS90_01530 [Trueperella pecoris]|uniref:Uncharacterized protein n=1 Tax=Trueperella pecoris TaxID=2733571 RepID=A0A7M1R145_9ACTO|nr:hypothetical protein [Trueperella pecoris]QOR48010.1 hypothetical protein INS90_01530 [Trueperella pecoris]